MANHPNLHNPGPDAEAVRALRESLGMTQTDAAKVFNWSLRGWQQIELDERRLTAQQWALWKHIAGVEPMPFTRRK